MRGISGLRICMMAFVALLMATRAASAQVTTGFITGTVQDGQGGVIPGATVTLISEARGTRSAPTVTGPSGDFVFPNVSVDTYTIEVMMDSFKTLRRPGVAVSAGSRVAVGALTIEIGVAGETVEVKGEAPVIQAASGERSFTIPTESVQNLPLANRSFTALAQLAPGVTGTSALGTRANMSTNFTMDGISTMDTGSNTVMLQMNTESIAEVKLLVSGYQAEYGRSSGLQVMAVTKSGTNQFRGSFYDVERNSDWDANSKQNILNGLPKTVSKQRDIGYSIGGPIGKPGGQNKLFFFHSAEFRPRTGRQRPADLPRADRARTPGRFLTDGRRQRRAVPVHQGSAAAGRLQRDDPGRLLRGWRRARADPAGPPLSAGSGHPQDVADAYR